MMMSREVLDAAEKPATNMSASRLAAVTGDNASLSRLLTDIYAFAHSEDNVLQLIANYHKAKAICARTAYGEGSYSVKSNESPIVVRVDFRKENDAATIPIGSEQTSQHIEAEAVDQLAINCLLTDALLDVVGKFYNEPQHLRERLDRCRADLEEIKGIIPEAGRPVNIIQMPGILSPARHA